METPLPRSVLFDAYAFGFRAFCAHIRLLCLTLLCAFGGFLILGAVAVLLGQVYQVSLNSGFSIATARVIMQNVPRGIIVFYSITMLLYAIYALAGCIRITLDLCRTGTSSVKRLFAFPSTVLLIWITFVLMLPILAVAFAALLIPGLILTVRFALVPWIIVDQRVNPIQAIMQSWRLTAGYFWEMAALLYLNMGIELLQSFPLKAVAYSISYLAIAYFYRAMLAKNTQVPYAG